ncbi:recombinase [Pseudooceanicola sp. CBS1P-1]|uniref:Recombinase n=1 Tax=Pseudooceanicola albus TaxID=2692189 RepID=A0A6L7FY49_9RHOB|nr:MULTISPECIES: recombinase [Pseudooceanicola]MBT9383468.1 recombinase [Pseudooceanicola endophyticus]MXN16210.1 recombinase [Pseudooceanicola albus]
MNYKKALWDGSDPAYAPGAVRSRNFWYWKPSLKYRQMGYAKTSVRLTGQEGDGQELIRARECRELTKQMLAHFQPEDEKYLVGTWGWLIHHYKTDRHSPIHAVKANTREGYVIYMDKLAGALGDVLVAATTYPLLCEMRDGMIAKGRSPSYIKKIFTHLRIVANYGVLIEHAPAQKISRILGEMRIPSAPKKTTAPTRTQVRAIVDQADANGLFAFATGLLFQWVFCLRAVDVRGQWLECAPEDEGIVRELARNRHQRHMPRKFERWQDGLTWEMFDDGLTGFRKTISKTSRSMPEPLWFDLTHAPELRARLHILGSAGRKGPVIVGERIGMPYTRDGWTQAFIRCRRAAGISESVKMMDTRAGGLSEAGALGLDPMILRDAAGHQNVATTDRYVRNREANIARVVQLRNAARTK